MIIVTTKKIITKDGDGDMRTEQNWKSINLRSWVALNFQLLDGHIDDHGDDHGYYHAGDRGYNCDDITMMMIAMIFEQNWKSIGP